jgi:hypothetical protein
VNAGYGCAEYTGSLKEFERFCDGDAQVLIASRPILVGKDGLQKVCNNIIINTLPWTNAQYQQLVGRLIRRGQSKTVKIHIIKARLNGYPYDERMKWNRIVYKILRCGRSNAIQELGYAQSGYERTGSMA